MRGGIGVEPKGKGGGTWYRAKEKEEKMMEPLLVKAGSGRGMKHDMDPLALYPFVTSSMLRV